MSNRATAVLLIPTTICSLLALAGVAYVVYLHIWAPLSMRESINTMSNFTQIGGELISDLNYSAELAMTNSLKSAEIAMNKSLEAGQLALAKSLDAASKITEIESNLVTELAEMSTRQEELLKESTRKGLELVEIIDAAARHYENATQSADEVFGHWAKLSSMLNQIQKLVARDNFLFSQTK